VSGWARFTLPILCGLFAFMVARDLGLPTWRDWQIGDAFDFALVTYLIAERLLVIFADRKSA
jgi:hypothetical protein